MQPNPIEINIEANSKGEITCIANASYHQKVTLTWGHNNVVFVGTGEELPMKNSITGVSYSIAAEKSSFTIKAKFEYSSDSQSGPYKISIIKNPAVISKAEKFTIIEVMSEDSSDNDNNDSYLTIVLEPE